MSEANKETLGNLTALAELDKTRFRSLTIDVKEARRRAEDILAAVLTMREAFIAAELKEQEKAEEAAAEERAAQEAQEAQKNAVESAETISEESAEPETVSVHRRCCTKPSGNRELRYCNCS